MLTMLCAALVLELIGYLIQNVPLWRAEKARLDAEYERQQAADNLETQQLIYDLDAIHKKLGRYPNDEAELVDLRGKPMPVTHAKNRPSHPISYRRDPGNAKYGLHFLY
jgi:hypothetical protein